MVYIHKSTNLVSLSSLLCSIAVLLVFYLANSQVTAVATSVPSDLLTGLNIGKLSSKVAITGTLVNPQKFELRFETLSSLLSLFDLQERVKNQLQLIDSASEGNGTQSDEEYLDLLTTQALLENIIQTSCTYIDQTLRDFFINIPNFNCNGFTPRQRSFSCSKEAAKQLQLLLKFWALNRDSHYELKELCTQQRNCASTARHDWVNQLPLDASDPADLEVNKYLNCIV